jgi:hypothetical protein
MNICNINSINNNMTNMSNNIYNFFNIPNDLLNNIKQFLSYKERAQFLLVCKCFSDLKMSSFRPKVYKNVVSIGRKHYYDFTYQMCVNTFDPSFIPCPFFYSKCLQIIIYDTPKTYYDIRLFKTFDQNKKIDDYLSDYGKDARDYFIRRKIEPLIYIGISE